MEYFNVKVISDHTLIKQNKSLCLSKKDTSRFTL